jgi:RNA polymerase-binding transcription factor DksA
VPPSREHGGGTLGTHIANVTLCAVASCESCMYAVGHACWRDADVNWNGLNMAKAARSEDYSKLAKRLEQERASTQSDLDSVSQEIDGVTADDEQEGGVPSNHPGDEGSDVYENERLQTVRAELEARLALIDAAQQRLADGTYGTCARCGKPIPRARLEALPWAEYDVECQGIVDGEDPNRSQQPLTPLA